jgi:hypothetical protein
MNNRFIALRFSCKNTLLLEGNHPSILLGAFSYAQHSLIEFTPNVIYANYRYSKINLLLIHGFSHKIGQMASAGYDVQETEFWNDLNLIVISWGKTNRLPCSAFQNPLRCVVRATNAVSAAQLAHEVVCILEFL